ncbi:unnamed protein product [Penicillium nalgiovense]|uniref:Uncharacterized protein n=1 Tax=Penicillium nalgiovense TaxID=60175 RepID=A0A9W4MV29_PENNA|nr:unnamed protein product [Penicillium nalgiovense]CAG8054717.1 unnamed protein product [Penicillium nalgiovense]CAG8057485.1 unnamed protein product [Penicillium nalgiovense]CAG8065476.1 unnamed protein product [Penicillium nalgiovense]CAG8065842.1 unnamed protein product [Penicillium nalgiovense]
MPLEIGLWTHQPRNILDWINLAQLVGVWALFICLFALNLYYNSAGRLSKALTILIYIGFLMISLMPLVVDATTDVFCPPDRPNCPEIDRDAIAMFEGLHSNLLLPFFTIILLVIGFYRQMRKPIQNLSLTGLKLQAAVFTLSAISWAFRLYFPWHLYHEDPRRSWPLYLILPAWYQGVGFVAFDDAAFALGQGILLYLALRQQRRAGAADAERQPLLAQGA